ncbi:MAG: digeranylgeranylglyceryl phosphate synthase, partial [Candidatus Zixiibacteriota bacterium]
MQRLRETLRLIRVENCALAMVGVLVGAEMTWLHPEYYGPIVAALAAFLICAGGNIVNDVADIAIDRINR